MKDRVTIITPTYRPDHDITRSLCQSIDQYFQGNFRHLIIVPRSDLKLFSTLAGEKREVVVAESLLNPHGFRKLPLPSRLRIPGLIDKRLREQWYKQGAGRLTGWLIQQILKLQSAELTDDEVLVFIDSDLKFIRPVDTSLFYAGDRLRLHRGAGALASSAHHSWRREALRLIGLDATKVSEVSYIGNIVTWKRSNLVRLLEHVEAVNGRSWRSVIAETKAISEYMLYGYFTENCLPNQGGQRVEPFGAVHSLWTGDENAREDFVSGLKQSHMAVHVQSAAVPNPAECEALIEAAVANLLKQGGRV